MPSSLQWQMQFYKEATTSHQRLYTAKIPAKSHRAHSPQALSEGTIYKEQEPYANLPACSVQYALSHFTLLAAQILLPKLSAAI